MTPSVPPPRIRIHSHVSPTHFLHVEDATPIGKLRLFAGTYRPGSGATLCLHHFIDIPDMRVLCHTLIATRIGYDYSEYKGTLHDRQRATSRVLRIHTRTEQVWLELNTGPGTLTRHGTIVPDRQERDRVLRVHVPLAWHTAQSCAHEVLAFLHARDVLRALHHKAQGYPPPPYPTYTPGEAEAEVITYGDSPHPLPPATLLRATYGNGTTVAPDEYAAFHAYLYTKGMLPPSRAALLRWSRTHRIPPTQKGARPEA